MLTHQLHVEEVDVEPENDGGDTDVNDGNHSNGRDDTHADEVPVERHAIQHLDEEEVDARPSVTGSGASAVQMHPSAPAADPCCLWKNGTRNS